MRDLPNDFISSLSDILDAGEQDEFLHAMREEEPPVSVRLNQAKPDQGFGDDIHSVPWAEFGFYLLDRPSFTRDPYFHGGHYYVQEASSMLVGEVVRQLVGGSDDLMALDLCAAPGGKSTHLLDVLGGGSMCILNEMVRSRFNILDDNLGKWGRRNMIRTSTSAEKLASTGIEFDLILVDAPCSGEGMMRKDPQAVEHWSLANVNVCAMRQRQILTSAHRMLKAGGLLVYSTCTFNKAENELIGDWLVREYGYNTVALDCPEGWGLTQRSGQFSEVYAAYPHKVKGEGLCIQVLMKNDEQLIQSTAIKKKPSLYSKTNGILSKSSIKPEEWLLDKDSQKVYGFNLDYWQEYVSIRSVVAGAIPGIRMADLKGKQEVPHHELALCVGPNDHFPVVELDMEAALSYLRGESITNEDAVKQGWAVVKYKDCRLGWVKSLPNRLNNYYPKTSRIKHL